MKRALFASLGLLLACEAVISFEGLEFGDGGGGSAPATGGDGGEVSTGGDGGGTVSTGGTSMGGSGGIPMTTSTGAAGEGACSIQVPFDNAACAQVAPGACSSCQPTSALCTIDCPGHPSCTTPGNSIQCPDGVWCRVNCSGNACAGKTVICPQTDDECRMVCLDAGSCTDARLLCQNLGRCEMGCQQPGACGGTATIRCEKKDCVATCQNGAAPAQRVCLNEPCFCDHTCN